jgi:hypothetical protein
MRSRDFPVAPWSTSLQVISLLGILLLVGVSDAAYRAIPTPSGFTYTVGLGVACIPLAVLAGCLFFIVAGYRVTPAQLSIRRLLTTTSIALAGLQRVWAEPAVCRGSLRIVGNGGLFAFCGVFSSKRLGRYRLFATDLRNTVVLQFKDRTVVISPAAPQAVVDYLHATIPGLLGAPHDAAEDRQRV